MNQVFNWANQPAELESYLDAYIKGQKEASRLVARAVKRAAHGMAKSGRPLESFLFLGPTGVGKTEMTLTACRFLYGENIEKHFVRFDMAEFQLQESLNILIGSNRNEQGILGDSIDQLNANGGGFMLFDEIEKANREIVKIFLSGLDAARMTMHNGSIKDLSRLFLVFTSNLGCAQAIQMEQVPYSTMSEYVRSVARDWFAPESFARFGESVVFKKLSFPIQMEICASLIQRECEHLSSVLKRKVIVDPKVFPFLVKKGFDRLLGARPMRKAVEREMGDCAVQWKEEIENAGFSSEGEESLLISVRERGLVALLESHCNSDKNFLVV